mmetsp:Transcript_4338/g.11909  ORF Transcript_4338/g.11909 Transcript_4338/m.11909 type:complete len:608 (-) Transcript_4338:154-1977(-)|eukprot:CAMPEP_0168743614 /NCGR_PEP_ID=MMETSP0724-20121128/13667_1 /TAXON_ID=265536 /ORGANISM="Amphiprora sp., Strain CCMP467" /LENGTH=607 /DNA_ID=CAMNT_0008791249 /DNA_START=163 /DNA_END=1986 /DNA_ORIENTATION=+
MKVETPQILWNDSEESSSNPRKKGSGALNAALYSTALLASGIPEPFSHVLVTAGNCSQINLWTVLLQPPSDDAKIQDETIFQHKATSLVSSASNNGSRGLEYRCSLGRDNQAVNCVKFSPDGLHLAVGGDGTNLQIYSVPMSKRGNGNGRHYWSQLTQDCCDLTYRVVNAAEGVTDLSWSADGQRILVASVDHSVCIVQRVEEDRQDRWTVIYRSQEHSHYVQGVAYDPKGAYLASMSNDRSVRVYSRKANAKIVKKVLKPIKQQQMLEKKAGQEKCSSAETATESSEPLQSSTKNNSTSTPSISPDEACQEWLANSKFEIGKTRLIRQTKAQENVPRHCWFADENTLGSFFRRLSWTADGHYLICPAALHRPDSTQQKQQQHAVLVFARHNFDEPHKVLVGFEKPAVAVRPNPVLFDLPPTDKENSHKKQYRNIFCVLTWDSVIIYDTHHTEPLAFISGLHYANLTDASWSSDGHSLVVSSSDGYITLIRFAQGELGTARATTDVQRPCPIVQSTAAVLNKVLRVDDSKAATLVPPCEPGPVQAVSRPPKKARITTVEEASNNNNNVVTKKTTFTLPQKRETAAQPNVLVPKKKKRIQPTLLVESK